MKFQLKRDSKRDLSRIENTAEHSGAPIALDRCSTVICARCHPRSEEAGEKRVVR